jgi:hypothetical protein
MSEVNLKLRRSGQYEFQRKLSQIMPDIIKEVTHTNMLFQSCIVCEHFQENEICKQYNLRPPAKIIVFGCDLYKEPKSNLDDDIPF